MAPGYKLVYFDRRGAAETIRLILKYGEIEFEDIRVKQEDWPSLKPKTPFGQLPYVEYDGKIVNQSLAIARFFAKKANLAGKDNWEDLEIDAVIDTINDLKYKMRPIHKESNAARKKALFEAFVKEAVPFYFQKLEALVEKNHGFLAVDRLTWADLHFVSGVSNLERLMLVSENSLEKYPNLKELVDRVNNIPTIKKWIEERPQTEY